ncbi:hypothetical protein F4809DRAFT_636772 [Biscogniauxia mediterranea]|nr:hypothetical protein F4809DRAFT_636772 [Biscogniauxia mediterranea]
MMMALMTNTSQLGRSVRESREMAESPILHELPRIRSVAPANPPPAPHLSSSTTPVAPPPVDSYFALQIHSKSVETKRISALDPEKSAIGTGIAITTHVPSSPASLSSIPSASPYTPVSPSLFPIPPSRSSTPNVSIPTSRSASTLLSTTTRGCGSSLGDAMMGTSSTSIASPPTTFSSPASTPAPFSPKRMSIFPRCQRMPPTPSPVYSPPRCRGANRSPRPYAEKYIEAGSDYDKGGLYIETKNEEKAGEKLAPARPRGGDRTREGRRQSAAALSVHSTASQAETTTTTTTTTTTPRSPAYAGSWLEVPCPPPRRPVSGASTSSPSPSLQTDDAETDSDSISPILARPAALRAFGTNTNTSRHTTYVVDGGDYDTHSMSAMWFGETRKRACDYPCYVGPEPDFAVAVVRERQRRRRRARRVKMAGGAAVIAVLFIVAIVVGVSLSIR